MVTSRGVVSRRLATASLWAVCCTVFATDFDALHKAAEQGNAVTQRLVAVCYRDGTSVGKDPKEAVTWFRKAAEQGDAHAQCHLGRCYKDGTGVTQDPEQAAAWFRKAISGLRAVAERGDADAQRLLGNCHYNGDGVERDLKEAVTWYRKAAEQGNADAQHLLGACFYGGEGVEKDLKQAAMWFRKAAEQGDPVGQCALGLFYSEGIGVDEDPKQAAVWLRKAAEQGLAEAQYRLAFCYREGTGIEKGEHQAVVWYRKAAEQGHTTAQYNLGLCLWLGEGVERDLEQADVWFAKAASKLRQAAEDGDAGDQYLLGQCYELGRGLEMDAKQAELWLGKAAAQGHVDAQASLGTYFMYMRKSLFGLEPNPSQGVMWCRKAAEQGCTEAQYNLGTFYKIGMGVEIDMKQAAMWFRKAAEQGHPEAQYYLGQCYESGNGILQDDIEACKCYLLAAANGDKSASDRVAAMRGAQLSDNAYREAQRRAQTWQKTQKGRTRSADLDSVFPFGGEDRSRVLATGSGFLISNDGYFLTCAHILAEGRAVTVSVGGTRYAAKVVRTDRVNDAALLKLTGNGFTTAPLRQNMAELGERVFTVGFPNPDIQGSAAKVTDGVVSSLSGIMDDIRTYQISVPVQPGNSGGILADPYGNCIGIVVAKVNAVVVLEYTGTIPENVNFAVKISYAMPLISTVPGLASRLPPQRKATALPKDFSAAKEVEKAVGLVSVYARSVSGESR